MNIKESLPLPSFFILIKSIFNKLCQMNLQQQRIRSIRNNFWTSSFCFSIVSLITCTKQCDGDYGGNRFTAHCEFAVKEKVYVEKVSELAKEQHLMQLFKYLCFLFMKNFVHRNCCLTIVFQFFLFDINEFFAYYQISYFGDKN